MEAEKRVLVRTFLVLSLVSVASISVIYILSLHPAESNSASRPPPPTPSPPPPPHSVCWDGPALFQRDIENRESNPPHQQQQEDISLSTHDSSSSLAMSLTAASSSSSSSSSSSASAAAAAASSSSSDVVASDPPPAGRSAGDRSSSMAASRLLDGMPRGGATGTRVQVVGVGCRSCYAGSTCSFDIRLSSGAFWHDSELTRRRELMVKIDGPSLLEGAALPVTSSGSGLEWSVSYTPFDAGVYRVSVYAECAIPPQPGINGSLFSIPIKNAHDQASNTIARFRLTVYKDEPSPRTALPPCDGGFFGRWLPLTPPNKGHHHDDDHDHDADGDVVHKNDDDDDEEDDDVDVDVNINNDDDVDVNNNDDDDDVDVNSDDDDDDGKGKTNGYRWEFFDCAKQVDAVGFVEAMAAKGIREISFVGDSHNRRLYHHVAYLLTGSVKYSERIAHNDLSRDVSVVGGGRRVNLTLRFIFVPGLWDGSGSYGCPVEANFERRRTTPHLPSGGLFVFNSAHWTYTFCREPEMAYARYLPDYLEWGRRLADQEGSRLVWRSTTAFNVRTWGCRWGLFEYARNYTPWRRRGNGKGETYRPPLGRTNAGLRLANEFAKRAADVAGFQYYDSWQVEAPFYFDSSSLDCHYSDVTQDGRMRGIVGEAVARHFMSWAATRMR
ncbi:hypothetical protein CBR_g49345 [Chara braunii]|uniref:Uncharacterized protein n=1 Tax=Chara braunii TaxID=69332 RepID=A0A388M4T8_CHABU|nr:hypothetical protein CBR_g49345 [Chara braunii]|eukprot:GBG89556.1 hypothetical protein CBR_g49345 [Chara braunii]